MNSSRSQNPFVLVLLIVGLLGLLSFFQPELTVGGVALRPVRLLADILRKDPAAVAALDAPPPNGPPSPASLADSVATAPADSTAATPADSARARRPAVPNLGGLDSFLAALRQTKATGSPTRIAYFGDSMIEGDLVTGDLRNSLQTEFGGTGVGYVPINSVTADFRATIRQSYSPNWREYNLVSTKVPEACPLGISGHSFSPRQLPDSSWVQFQASRQWAPLRRFTEAHLFYGPGDGQDEVLVTTDGHRVPHALSGTAAVNEMVLKPGTPARAMRLAFATHDARPVYGVSFESPQGVTLDNFSFRGNSGMSLTRIPAAQLMAFGNVLDYRLIILHYGVNVAHASVKNYGFYERAMTRVVDRMQRAFPNASILIIGMSDKSSRIEGEFVTDPSVPRLVAAQQRLASRNHAAFWNLFEAMGGENSMVGWVENKPALANHDYTHVNSRGARKIADLLYAYLMEQYAHPTAARAQSAATRPDSSHGAARPAPTPGDSVTR